MSSILNSSSNKSNFYILHNDPDEFLLKSGVLKGHINLNNLTAIKFDKEKVNFPNLENTHVSEATYYRLYLENYLPDNIDNLIYIDPDTVCLNNPENELEIQIKKLNMSHYSIAAFSESEGYTKNTSDYEEVYKRLGMKNRKYFNAGIMIIDFKKWIDNDTTNSLIEKMYTIFDNIVYWDQDVMNSFFDGEYLELADNFNFTVPIDVEIYSRITSEKKFNEIYFLHYAGKFKPWNIKGLFHPAAECYQSNFRLIMKDTYHIVNNWKYLAVKDFLKSIFSFKFLNLKFPIKYIKHVFIYLFTINKRMSQ